MSKAEMQPLPHQWWQADADPEPDPDPPADPPSDPEPVEAKWPDNWRENMAGEDEKEINQLKRYATPAEIWKKARSLEQKISSGEYKMRLSETPSEEELAEYRTAHGIPEAPDGYDLSFDDGLVIGEADKPIIDGFLQDAHARNMSPEDVKANIQWYYKEQERMSDERAQKDVEAKDQAEDVLRQEWGGNYRTELNGVSNFLNSMFPAEFKEKLMTGRTADNIPLGSSPEFLMAMASIARKMNPLGTLAADAGPDASKQLDTRLKEIENILKTDRARYNREELAKEKFDLLQKKDKMKA